MKRPTGPQQELVCTRCQHVWAVCRLPIRAVTAGAILTHAHCPSCNTGPANLRMLATHRIATGEAT